MKYTEQILNQNEKVLQQAKISFLTIVPQAIASLFFLVIAIVCFAKKDISFAGYIFLVPFAVELIRVIKKIIIITTTELCVTTQRIIKKVGIISRHTVEAPIEKVDNVTMTQNFWDRIFKIGMIKIETTSEPIYTKYVADVNNFKTKVTRVIDTVKKQQKDEIAKQQAYELAKAMRGEN